MTNLTGDMIEGAIYTQDKYGVPASITLGQIMLESGGKYEGGLSGLAYKAKNLFGIKGKGTDGSVTMPTKEVINGKTVTVNAVFAKYKSFKDSIIAHGKLLTNKRYTNKTKNAKTVEDYANGIANAGYATDPDYAKKLLKQINAYDLTKYDSGDYKQSVTNNYTTNDSDYKIGLKWWGDIVNVVLIIGLCILAVYLFTKSF